MNRRQSTEALVEKLLQERAMLAEERGFSSSDLRSYDEFLARLDENSATPLRSEIHDAPVLPSPLMSRRIVAAAGSFVIVMVVGLGTALLIGNGLVDEPREVPPQPGSITTNEPRPVESSPSSPIPRPSGPGSLVLPLIVEGDRTTVNVSFTDGRSVDVSYPSSWYLHEHIWKPGTGIILWLDEPRDNGQGYLYASLDFAFNGTTWTESIRFRPEWTDEEEDLALELLDISIASNAFVTVRTTPPLYHFTPDPVQRPPVGEELGAAWILVGDTIRLDSGCSSDTPVSRYQGALHWCDADAGVAVTFYTSSDHYDQILKDLDFDLVADPLSN